MTSHQYVPGELIEAAGPTEPVATLPARMIRGVSTVVLATKLFVPARRPQAVVRREYDTP